MLDLINDYLRFVIAFFGVINASAPHIYHSALPLSPRTSIVHKLYESHARPFVRVVRGLPSSWKSAVATVYHDAIVESVEWSPCGRFIAVAPFHCTEVLDAVTLERLYTFKHPRDGTSLLCFSPDSRLLTRCNAKLELTSWDLQTGGPVSAISSGPGELHKRCHSSTYSMDGKMLAVVYGDSPKFTSISTYDLLSRTHICCYHSPEGFMVVSVWTHGGCIRFATMGPGSIGIWEVGFTSTDAPTEIERLPIPGDLGHLRGALFLPTLSRLASSSGAGVLIWDARDSKLLLNTDNIGAMWMSFSSDGCFFACGTVGAEIYIWKESHTGYILHKRLMFTLLASPRPFLSPGGESIVTVWSSTVQLWRTTDPTPSTSIVPVQPVGHFILEFSPDETLAAVGRVNGNTVTVLDLKSGDPRLIIDAGMGIIGLRVTWDTVVVVGGEGKVITWTMPTGDCTFNAQVNIDESVRATTFDYSGPHYTRMMLPNASISPSFDRVVAKSYGSDDLSIYDMSTRECLASTATGGWIPWFTPDGHEVWCVGYNVEGWSIVKDSESGVTKLEPLGLTTYPSGGVPCRSSRGYRVTDDWWVVSPSGKRLLWLPHDWRSSETSRRWSGRFLGLLHHELPEAVILELDE